VNPLTTFVRSLGNERALANARSVLDARVLEQRLVECLVRRLEDVPETTAETGTAA
jgi:hypothetical protein